MTDTNKNVETSLTAPSDKDPNKKYIPLQGNPILTNEETNLAMDDLNITAGIKNYPSFERVYVDPKIDDQKICIHSFVPSLGAKPDEDGIYGMIKFRGSFETEEEANNRAEWLIRNTDSYHKIYHAYVGRPFPITVSSNFSKEKIKIDIKNHATKIISEDIKQKRMKDKQDIEDIKNREKKLLEDSKKVEKNEDIETPLEKYTMEQVKKSQLIYAFTEGLKKMKEIKNSIIKCRKYIEEMNKTNPDFMNQYKEEFFRARKEAGFEDTKEKMEEGFLKYIGNEIELDNVKI